MLFGLGVTGVVYILVSIFTVAVVPIGVLGESTTPLLDMVRYERFGLGRTWNDEYGTAQDATDLVMAGVWRGLASLAR